MADTSRDRSDLPVVLSGSAVILTGNWLKIVGDALVHSMRRQKSNGLPINGSHVALIRAVQKAMSASGESDVRNFSTMHDSNQQKPTVCTATAAKQLGMSERQVRRLAPRLGGQLIGKRWLLDQRAIDEHKEGRKA